MRDISELRWLRERALADRSYKRDQANILCRALDNLESIILDETDGTILARRKRQRTRIINALESLALEKRALDAQIAGIERDLYTAGESYANLSSQWRAASDRARHSR